MRYNASVYNMSIIKVIRKDKKHLHTNIYTYNMFFYFEYDRIEFRYNFLSCIVISIASV